MTPAALLTTLTADGLSIQLAMLDDRPDPASGAYRLLVSPTAAISAKHRALVRKHREALIDHLLTPWVDAVWPAVDLDAPAIRWACTPWPGDLAPELSTPHSSHYRYVEDAE